MKANIIVSMGDRIIEYDITYLSCSSNTPGYYVFEDVAGTKLASRMVENISFSSMRVPMINSIIEFKNNEPIKNETN